jgi:hypothetical protein
LKPDARTTTIAQELGIDDAEIARRKSFLEFTDADVELLRQIHTFSGSPTRERMQQTLPTQLCQADFERADHLSYGFIKCNPLCSLLMMLQNVRNMSLSNLTAVVWHLFFLVLHCSLPPIRPFTTQTGS